MDKVVSAAEKIAGMIYENRYFFLPYVVFLIVGAFLLNMLQKGEEILYWNDSKNTVLNLFFLSATRLGEAWAYIPAFIWMLFIKYRFALYVPLIGIVSMAVSYVTKDFFGHPRPYLFFETTGMLDHVQFVEGLRINKGYTSFPSGHTLSAFALYAYLAFCISKKRLLSFFLLVAAFLVGFSRIYLVQHFFEDVYLGALLGVFIAMAIFLIQKYWPGSARWDACIHNP